MANIDQLIAAEHAAHVAINYADYWVTDAKKHDALMRADYLLSEVRQAGYFLTDLECTPHLKEEATRRLVQAIINCK
jgi:hypothetical protein